MIVFNRIAEFRKKMNYSQRELASLIGLSSVHIDQYENCSFYPSLDVVFRLIHVFNCSFYDLFYIDNLEF